MAFGVAALIWLIGGLAGHPPLLRFLAWPVIVLAGAAAGYSAFLFGQAEGRDFWQSPLLLWHLLVGAVLAGAASLILLALALGRDPAVVAQLTKILALGLAAEGLLLLADLAGYHPNQDVAGAARLLSHGSLSGKFWGGVMAAGIVLPLLLLLAGTLGTALASLLALAGLWLYERLWVRAGQSVPLS
jgi:formate-dependent nitrite reductase membrane component NrfD